MRILLLIFSDILPFALTKVLNPANDYCAIVVDEPEISKKMFEDVPQIRDKIFPFYELRECIANLNYDLLLCVNDLRTQNIWQLLKSYGLPAEKFLHVSFANNKENFSMLEKENFLLLERALRYYKEHSAEFEIFTTGTSFVRVSIDTNRFTRRNFNFAVSSQDLYYDYKIAQFIFNECENKNLKYALIGITPFVFHYDVTRHYSCSFRLFQYLIAFNDLHNFPITLDKYRNRFNEDFLNTKLDFSGITVESVLGTPLPMQSFTPQSRMFQRSYVELFSQRDGYPETCQEYVKILDDYLTLCEKNNVRPVIFTPPITYCYKKYSNPKILDEFYVLMSESQKKHTSAVFFDGWKSDGFSDEYFYDVGHMNIKGAAKFSTLLNGVIEELERKS